MIAGIAVLVAAGFFGYMLALLQRRVAAMFSSRRVSNMDGPLLVSCFFVLDQFSFNLLRSIYTNVGS